MMEHTSDAAQYYWSHQFIASFGLALTCFLAGVLVGAILWAGRKKKALQVEARNQDLRRQIGELEMGDQAAVEAEVSETQMEKDQNQ